MAMAQTAPMAFGVVDLSGWDWKNEAELSLNGDWEFYWQQFYDPQDFARADVKQRELIPVPANWMLEGYPLYGYATYRLTVKLDQPRELAIRLPWIQAASRIFIDGQEVAEIGQVSSRYEASEYEAKVSEDYWVFTPKEAEFEIVIQVANHNYIMAGIVGTPEIGSPAVVKASYILEIGLLLFFSGCVLIMGIYHFCLFALRTEDQSTLYFGLVCIVVSLYMIASHLPTITTIWPQRDFNNAIRFYLIWTLSPGPFALFLHSLFPRLFSKRLAVALTLALTGLYLIVLFWDFDSVTGPLFAFQGITVPFLFYALYTIIKAVRRREEGAIILLGGSVILLITAIHDMFKYLYDSPNLGGFGLLTFIICQSVLIARRFSTAFHTVEASEKEIRKLSDDLQTQNDKVIALNENLEHLVDEKTRDICSIMKHIDIGILAMTRPGFAIARDYSVHLKEIFAQNELAGMDACDLLFSRSSVSADEISQATAAIDCCLNEHEIAFETNKHCLPRELIFQRSEEDRRILELTWNAITNDEAMVEKILVTIKDVTELRILEEESHDRKEELELISELLDVSSEVYGRFTTNARDLMAENRKLLDSQSIRLKDLSTLKVMFINVHTVKGAARSLYFKKMTKVFHEVEQYFADLQQNPAKPWNLDKMYCDLNEAEEVLALYDEINEQKLGRKVASEKNIELPRTRVSDLLSQAQRLKQWLGCGESVEARSLVNKMEISLVPYVYTPVDNVMDDICQCLDTLAKDLGKVRPKVHVDANDLWIDQQGEQLMRKVFVHLLRNSMDHGIETADLRRQQGKPAQGQILVSFREDGDAVLLHYEDDGQGLNLSKIRKTAYARNLLEQEESLSVQETAELIFQSGLSTASHVNDISGRGVGMDAIRRFLWKANSEINIVTKDFTDGESEYYPFSIVIRLDKSFFFSRTFAHQETLKVG